MKSIINTTKNVFVSNGSSALVCNAFEKFLLKKSSESQTPFLFVRRTKPIIFIGCNQNPSLDLNLDLMKEREIELGRLTSGGGGSYFDKYTLVASFIKGHNHNLTSKPLDIALNNSIIEDCLKNFIENDVKTISKNTHAFLLKTPRYYNLSLFDEKIGHISYKPEGIHRISLNFSNYYSALNVDDNKLKYSLSSKEKDEHLKSNPFRAIFETEGGGNPFLRRSQYNSMFIHSIGGFTKFNEEDFEAYIVKMFQRFYPPQFSYRMRVDDVDISKGAVHGMSNAWKQMSLLDSPDKMERENGVKYVSETDMLEIPEVKALYDIKKSKSWLYQDHNYSHSDSLTKYILQKTFKWGRLDLHIFCDINNIIKHIDCYSDSLYRNLPDVLRPVFLNVMINDKQELMDSFQMHLCQEIIEDTGAIFIINDVKEWIESVDLKNINRSHL